MNSHFRCRVVHSGTGAAQDLMDRDAAFLAAQQHHPEVILHHYEWKSPSATYGHFLNPEQLLDVDEAQRLGVELAKRPTGGGIIFHLFDLAFSVHLPAHHPLLSLTTLDNYALINRPVGRAITRFLVDKEQVNPHLLPCEPQPWDESCRHFCMAKPTCFDVMLGDKKVCGAAQRRTRFGLLHQGSISLTGPDPVLLGKLLKSGNQVLAAMQHHTYPLLSPTPLSAVALQQGRARLRELISEELLQVLEDLQHFGKNSPLSV